MRTAVSSPSASAEVRPGDAASPACPGRASARRMAVRMRSSDDVCGAARRRSSRRRLRRRRARPRRSRSRLAPSTLPAERLERGDGGGRIGGGKRARLAERSASWSARSPGLDAAAVRLGARSATAIVRSASAWPRAPPTMRSTAITAPVAPAAIGDDRDRDGGGVAAHEPDRGAARRSSGGLRPGGRRGTARGPRRARAPTGTARSACRTRMRSRRSPRARRARRRRGCRSARRRVAGGGGHRSRPGVGQVVRGVRRAST